MDDRAWKAAVFLYGARKNCERVARSPNGSDEGELRQALDRLNTARQLIQTRLEKGT